MTILQARKRAWRHVGAAGLLVALAIRGIEILLQYDWMINPPSGGRSPESMTMDGLMLLLAIGLGLAWVIGCNMYANSIR